MRPTSTPIRYKRQSRKTNKRSISCLFCNSGAEANEAALKLARKATGRTKILTFEGSFHGRTFGAMTATAQESIHQDFGPLVPDFEYLPFNEFSPLQAALDEETAAVMMELVQGEGGVIPAEKNGSKRWPRYVKKQVHC